MVSILVPVYNVAQFIEKCARSLFEQTYDGEIEYIFVNDGSPDDSMRILNEAIRQYPHLREKIHIINHEHNRGLAAARNTAVNASSGDFILHVDSDDWLEKDAVKSLVDMALKENADVVVSDFREVRKNGSHILKNEYSCNGHDYAKLLLRRKSLTHIIGKLIRRNLLVRNDLYAIEGLNQGEDYLLTPKIAYFAKKISKVDAPIYNYNRTNVGSYTANVNAKGIENVIEVQNHLNSFFSSIKEKKEFSHTIAESSIYTKLTCFYCGPLSSYKRIAGIYPDIDWKKMELKGKQKLILTLADMKLYKAAYSLIRLANKLS